MQHPAPHILAFPLPTPARLGPPPGGPGSDPQPGERLPHGAHRRVEDEAGAAARDMARGAGDKLRDAAPPRAEAPAGHEDAPPAPRGEGKDEGVGSKVERVAHVSGCKGRGVALVRPCQANCRRCPCARCTWVS
jgi:hypothetical protein